MAEISLSIGASNAFEGRRLVDLEKARRTLSPANNCGI